MLKDVLKKDLKVVFCGTAKGKASATKGYYYAGPGNKFYAILHPLFGICNPLFGICNPELR